jgi:hypothetical protein
VINKGPAQAGPFFLSDPFFHQRRYCALAQTATAATGILIPLPPLKRHTYELPDGVDFIIVGGI